MKTCSKCKIEKPLGEFFTDKNKLSGYHSQCKPCHVFYKKQHNKKIKGVYGLFDNSECLYVGESEQLKARIWEHKSNLKNVTQKIQTNLYLKLQQHHDVTFRILEECNNHKEREQYYINTLKPKYNGI